MPDRRTRLGLTIVLLALAVPPALAQEATWHKLADSGIEAHESGRYADAERSFHLALKAATSLDDQQGVAWILDALASVASDQARFREAERLARQALAIRERVLEPDHRDLGASFNTLAEIYSAQRKDEEAEAYFRRALDLYQRSPTAEPSDLAELWMFAQHARQPVIGNAAAKMMHVVDADIGGEPAQHRRQIVMR